MTPFGSDVEPEVYCKNAMSLFSITYTSGLAALLVVCMCEEDAEDFPVRMTSSTWIQLREGHLDALLLYICMQFDTDMYLVRMYVLYIKLSIYVYGMCIMYVFMYGCL